MRVGRSTIQGVSARVLLVAPKGIVREGIRAELTGNGAGVSIVAEAGSGVDAIAAADQWHPDVVLLDFKLPDAEDLCATLTRRFPPTAVIVLSQRGEESSVGAAIDSGARAYLLKDAADLDLTHAIVRVLAGERVIDERAAMRLAESRNEPKLTPQELKVLRLVAEGLTNPEIGSRLYLSRHTVKEYLSHAMRKLEVSNRIEAVRKAAELGLIEGLASAPGAPGQTLVYNRSGSSAEASELKVTPLKIDQLKTITDER